MKGIACTRAPALLLCFFPYCISLSGCMVHGGEVASRPPVLLRIMLVICYSTVQNPTPRPSPTIRAPLSGGTTIRCHCQERRRGSCSWDSMLRSSMGLAWAWAWDGGWDKNLERPFPIAKDLISPHTCQRYFTTNNTSPRLSFPSTGRHHDFLSLHQLDFTRPITVSDLYRPHH